MTLERSFEIVHDTSHALYFAFESLGFFGQLRLLLLHDHQFLPQFACVSVFTMHAICETAQTYGGQIFRDSDDEDANKDPEVTCHKNCQTPD